MKLNEIFNSPMPATSTTSHSFGDTVAFTIGNIAYEMLFASFGGDDWEISFDATMPNGDRVDHATGTGNEIAVFNAVNKLVSHFLIGIGDEAQTVTFTSNLNSRSKLYNRLATKWAKQYNLSLSVEQHGSTTEFVLTNPRYER